MATGTGNLPNPSMAFTPFDILLAEELNDLVENIEALATGSGIGDGAIGTSDLANGAVTSQKVDFTTFPAFIANKTATQTGVVSNAVIAFETEILDTNNAYNNSTHRFVAPIKGNYFFTAEAFANSLSNSGFIINLSKNGVSYARGGNGTATGFERGATVASLIPLDIGDYVDVRVQFISGSSTVEGSAAHKFSGFMVTRG